MEVRAKSGWLSREQLAASEFARRVAVKYGIGVVATLMKKKEQSRIDAAVSEILLLILATGVDDVCRHLLSLSSVQIAVADSLCAARVAVPSLL